MLRALLIAVALGALIASCAQLFGLDKLPPHTVEIDATPEGCAFRSVSAGRYHTCAVDKRGDVFCWGANDTWQSEPNGPDVVTTPTKITLIKPAVQVSAGRSSSCARLDDGSVWCWGANSRGELGIGVPNPMLGPNLVDLAGERAIDIDVGAFHACARLEANQAVVCWGYNNQLEVGTGSGSGMVIPTPFTLPGTEEMSDLSVGHRHNCGVTADATAVCWGKGDHIQLGTGSGASAARVAVPGLTNVTKVAAGGRASCAIANGSVHCWGRGREGQLGTGQFNNALAPGTPIVANAIDVGLGSLGGCALLADGGVQCWGDFDAGNGTPSGEPAPRTSSIMGATDLTVGHFHACAIVDGAVQCWGDNGRGELGRGMRASSASPVEVTLMGTPAGVPSRVSVGYGTACALTQEGSVFCWGENPTGTLGNGTRNGVYTPTAVQTGLTNITDIAVNYNRACAWNGTNAACWGYNENGVLGTGTASHDELSPVAVAPTPIKSMVLGGAHTCFISSANELRCWGDNRVGAIGNGTTASSTTPSSVVLLNTTQAVAGNSHTCARQGTNLYCWGYNGFGQLGTGARTNVLTPVLVLQNVTDVGAGMQFTCAIASGVVSCWGDNRAGQLGVGDRVDRLTPTPVSLPAAATRLAIAGQGACALLSDGRVFCWGDNPHGALGSSTLTHESPVELPMLAGADQIAYGHHGGCAIDGVTLRCWGGTAVLGTGDTSASTPMPPTLSCD